MTSIFGRYQCKSDMNTWISSIYCSKWGLKEGLRELLQNQRDELINMLGKENIETEAISNYDFNFLKKGTNQIYGKIRYDKIGEILSIENKGKLETFNLLLGGTTRDPNNSNGIVGQFGEGLKIAAIALLRLNKMFSIINNNQVWRFSLKEDINFTRENKPERCLFWRWEEYSNPENKDKVIIQIRNITLSEWENNIDCYLWMVSKIKKLGIITAGNKGDIILNPEFKNKVYSRGVYVTTTISDIGYGYNLDLTLDRDRNCIPNYSSFESSARSIIFYILENNNNYKKQLPLNQMDFTEIEMFDKFPKQILKLLDSYDFIGSKYISLSTNTANFLWELNVQLRRETDKRFNVEKMELAPQPLSNSYNFDSFVRGKNLSNDFYSYFNCHEPLENALQSSTYYISYNIKFEKFYQSKKVVSPPDDKIEKIIQSIVSKVKLFSYYFNRNSLEFKELESEESYYSLNGKYYFSSLLYDKPEKMEEFVFGKCLEMLNIKIMDLLRLFNIVQKNKN